MHQDPWHTRSVGAYRRSYSTDEVDAAEAFAYWADVICEVFVPLAASRRCANGFRGRIEVSEWDQVTISRVSAGDQRVCHDLSDARDDCLVSLQLAGSGRVAQATSVAALEPGDLAFYDASREYELTFEQHFAQYVIQFPRPLLLERLVEPEQVCGRRISAGAPLARMVAALTHSLAGETHELDQIARHRLSIQLIDILATVAGINLPASGSDRDHLVAAALDVAASRLGDPGLDVLSIAGQLGYSVRTVQRAFVGGDSLVDRIRAMRLARARDLLTDPRADQLSVAEIGARVGYPDPSTFTRAFRRAHSTTPRQFRLSRDAHADGG